MVSKNRTGEEGVSPEDQLARLDAALRASGVDVEALRLKNAGASYAQSGGYEPELRNLAAQGGGNNPEAAAARAGIDALKQLVALRVRDPQQAGALAQAESELTEALVTGDSAAIIERTNAAREAITTAQARLSDRLFDAQDLDDRESKLKQMWADIQQLSKDIDDNFEKLKALGINFDAEDERRLEELKRRLEENPRDIEAQKERAKIEHRMNDDARAQGKDKPEIDEITTSNEQAMDRRDMVLHAIEIPVLSKHKAKGITQSDSQEIKSTAFSREQNNGDERESAPQPIRSSMAERRRVNQPPKDGGNLEERNNKELASSSVDGSFASVNLTVDEVDSPHEAKEPNVRDVRDKSSPAGPVRQS